MDKNNKCKKCKKSIQAYREEGKDIPSDVLGSYTGNPEDEERPIQDSDDI